MKTTDLPDNLRDAARAFMENPKTFEQVQLENEIGRLKKELSNQKGVTLLAALIAWWIGSTY